MATASPTPVLAMRPARRPSTKLFVRRDSPSTNQVPEDSDDDLQPPPQLSDLGRSVLEQQQESGNASPRMRSKMAKSSRLTKSNISESHTPARDTTTPAAPSQRVKRVGLQGAPVRRGKQRTPQSEEDQGNEESRHPIHTEDHDPVPLTHDAPEQDQENCPSTIVRKSDPMVKGSAIKSKLDSIQKTKPEQPEHRKNPAVALATMSSNTPHRPAPPPPPKMSVLEAATKAAGASTTKRRSRKFAPITINGKTFTLIERCGKGGSAEVWKVQAENGKSFAMKKVRLSGADPIAVASYKGEIDILRKLQHVSRVVRLYDYIIDEDKQILYVIMELGEGDLAKVLSNKLETSAADNTDDITSQPKLDYAFIRYWWKEMLCCVKAVHDENVVHTDLKPANFLVSKGALKLIDFGIAGSIDIEQTVNMHRDNHVGTLNFMSPESLQDSSITNAGGPTSVSPQIGRQMKLGKPSDVWSLGCILYNMVYGQAPFGSIAQPMAKVLAIINPQVVIEFPAAGTGGSPVPAEVRRTLMRCLNRDPAKRPTLAQLLAPADDWLHPECGDDLRISEQLLDQIIRRVAERFKDKSKPPPTEEEIHQYAGSFYSRIRAWEN